LSVKTTDNNTMIVLTDKEWNKVLWWGTWLLWYKWAKKNTPYAAEMLTKSILKDAQGLWLKDVW
jgi:ribosomal protein S11